MTDAQQTQAWIVAVATGDELATRKLLAAYHPRLRAAAAARLDGPLKAHLEPEDVLQQVYLDVFRCIGQFEPRGPDAFVNWVLTILDHRIIDLRRAWHSQRRDVAREALLGEVGGSQSCYHLLEHVYADSQTPSRVARRDEAVGALLTSLGRISATHQEVIRLRFLEGRPVEEVAAQLGKTPGAVVALTRRALEALRTAMAELGDFTAG